MKNQDKKEIILQLDKLIPVEKPSLYQVVVENDDFTPMEFVITMLEKFFFMDRCKAAKIMLEAHTKGRSVCGIFSRDFAEAKIHQVMEYARSCEYPLVCSMEAD